MEDCIFCKIVRGELPCHKVFENDLVIAIMDIMPASDGHTLVMPKAHYETVFDMNEELAGEIMKVSWRLANVIKKTIEPDGMNIVQNNYPAANQVVPHFHLHLIPRNKDDGLGIGRWKPQESEQEKLERIASQIRQVM